MKPQSLRTDELDYDLPPQLIATRPVEPRDSARMLVLWRSDPARPLEHRHVRDLPDYLSAGDGLVVNKTAVIPARLIGRRIDTGGKVEGLYLNEEPSPHGEVHWRMMLKAGGRLRPGHRIGWLNQSNAPSGLAVELLRLDGAEWVVRLEKGGSTNVALEAIGWTPLPPYILHARGEQAFADQLDRQWYQTVYADPDAAQSVAAPTAGLHFTPALLDKIDQKTVKRIDLTLHVGPGTFKPVTAATLAEHRMHSESFEVSAEALRSIQPVRMAGGRLIAVGTTTVRTLESLPHPLPAEGEIYGPIAGMTDLMIAPPYEFRLVDGMLTNFHLPRSTLMALVAAMASEPGCVNPVEAIERLKSVYREAIAQRYRFYSYGDAMLILP